MSRLAENLVLLLLDDATGRSTVDTGRRYRAVGSAVLLDLVRAGRVTIAAADDAREARVQVVDAAPTGDPALDTALGKLAPKPLKVGWAAENLGHDCWQPLLELLAADGAIRQQEQRVLGLLKTTTWPAGDGTRERVVREAITTALHGAEPDEETGVLITILHGIGAVPGADNEATRARAAQIAKTGWAAGPLRDAFHGLGTAQLVTLFAAS
ncbi:GPP34 family phosphoprotein [Solwaraspora sp. WMMD791]|uniref:GOLPH3/VPS74 family protein n=1 Tax=Solwaraspora sp. WMMD791 TaxID=3016086 RepID=UPI00249A634B|nr:GPP34 family phosphoprotein [Solwaraspora sp. WMMD791]WFE30328.1 GPP34 family phosphoprotein [Solwaraspora sp. WMMD791]